MPGLIAYGLGFLLATGALLCASSSLVGFSVAKPLFVIGLLIEISASALLLKSARNLGIAGILLAVVLIALSFVPIYVEHVGDPDNPRSHRHILWWLDHNH